MPALSIRVAAAILLAAGPALPAPAAAPGRIAAALADPARPAADRARDADRKAADLLAFSGVKPGQTVVDLVPGGGYFTRLFSAAVGPKGHVVAYIPAEMAAHSSPDALRQAMTAEGRANVEVVSDPLMSPVPAEVLGTADLVWTAQNYHDLHNVPGADVVAYDRLVFGALRPGGAFVIVDHSAPAGSGLDATNTTHRIDPAVVRREVEAAGFRFAGMTRVLANPKDPLTVKVFDPSIRGHTDQFAFRFVKPAR